MSRPSVDEKKHGAFGDVKNDYDVETVTTVYDEAGPIEFEEKKELRRGLHQRHIQMIALAGTIGTGLFLGSGRAIVNGGPLGALLGYFLVGVLVVGPVISIAELSALVPLSGGIVRHAEVFFDPALSFANGWNNIYSYMVSLPAEITAAAVIVDFWAAYINNGIWITIFGLLLIASNVFLVRVYGELEFIFALLKIMLIVGLNLMSLIIVSGGGPDHHVYGAQYWRNPGPLVQYLGIAGNLGRFLGFWTTFNNAVYAYSGVETISLAAAETRSPRRNIPIAAKRIFWRVAIFYVMSIFFVGLLVPSNDDSLLHGKGVGAARSPFVIAATRAGIKIVPSIINAVVLTSAWSAGNSGLLNSSRTLYGLALEGRAPKIFKRVSRWGIPYVAVIFMSLFICLGFMSLSAGASTVFAWLQDLVSVAALVNWIVICGVYLRFYYAMKKQGISRERLPWKSPFQPYWAWVSSISFIILLLTGGYTTFIHGHWDNETFVSSYINIPIIFILYFGYKFIKKTKIVPLAEAPIMHFIEIADANPEPPAPPKTGWRRLNILWS
ncbi:hypothetical protein LTR62_007119 [Meristemomyces frigidus]|uniref:Amino acid permease/ SLC12A domain-containing protein n=1 Tax=Meristemomyces frigidus TaxID=1508187 RepID=A0AAN7YE05_9PEZI|nr:hypothetical protein LTR62_007119 [Meristemomyces frigidus]